LNRILHLIEESDADLDVFPEYATGVPSHSITREFVQLNAEPIDGEFASRILEKTLQKNSAAVFTTFLREDNAVYNAAILAERGVIRVIYRKVHLFDAFGYSESQLFAAGKDLAITNLKGFKVGLAVCFDLRFPELFRAMAYKGVNLFVVPSAWYKGKNKIEQWRTLIMARAHENVSYLVAASQTNSSFIGHSMAASPLGYTIKEAGKKQTDFTVQLDYKEIEEANDLVPTISLAKRELYKKFLEQA
jgi:predicted amidohydrolase